jgi:Rrf2 family protein
MIHSNATKYAIRAVSFLAAQPSGVSVQAREISRALDIPYPYLSKILQNLARKRFLSSAKGPGGGFRLLVPAEETTLYDLIEAVEGEIRDDQCMLGLDVCTTEAACPMHDFWTEFRDSFRDKMRSVSLRDVVESAEKKKQHAAILGI